MTKIGRRAVIAATLLSLALLPASLRPGVAQEQFPDRPVTLVVPFAAGGGTDTMARLLAQQLETELGVSVIVENKTGASGRVGADFVARSAPDGYTLVYGGPTVFLFLPIIAPESMPFDATTAFTPVMFFNKYDLVLTTAADNGIATLDDLIARMKSADRPVPAGTGGAGTSPHLAAVYLGRLTGTQVEPVHYRGSALAQTDTIGGRLLFNFQSVIATAPQIEAGKLTGVAIASGQRSPMLPDVPTIAEAGLPDFTKADWAQWTGLFAPAGTPIPVLEKLNAAVAKVMQSEETREAISRLNAEMLPPASLADTKLYFEKQYKAWQEVLGGLDIEME